MTHDETANPAPPTDGDRSRFITSFSAALLISSAGFALIFLFFGSLEWFTFHWLSTLPPAKASRMLSMMSIFARAFTVFLGVITSLICALVASRHAGASHRSHPNKSYRDPSLRIT
jgi:hypothetical protein